MTPPVGTNQRIRNRSIWAVALLAASVAPAIVGIGIVKVSGDTENVAMPLAFLFWTTGFAMALWAAYPTLRYWEGLPSETRWMGALPLLSISLFLSTAMIASILG
ncbi:MAG TPA: hypothetical protein VMI56_09060 [Reyranella sp.]|nr:hypothetical protein [Reyranella sp.]